MKKNCIIYLILILIISNSAYSQVDSLKNNNVELSKYYLGLGFGGGNSGFAFVVSTNFVLSNNWGANVSFIPSFKSAKNTPSDYDIFLWGPFDNLYYINLNLLKEFPLNWNQFSFGIEVGPSIVNSNFAYFTRNLSSSYDVSYEKDQTIGLSLNLKLDRMTFKYLGAGIMLYSNINRIESVFGAELYFNIGKVR